MKYSRLLAAVPCLVLAVSGWGRADDTKAVKAFNDAEFVKKAASGGMMEVEMGKLAKMKAQNPEVKKFGEKMVEDHSKANQELMALAKAEGMDVPTTMMEEHRKHIDMVKDLQGAEFDKSYVKHMVKDHEMDVKEFTEASQQAKSAKLKDFAAKTLPTLRSHLEMVKKLDGQTK